MNDLEAEPTVRAAVLENESTVPDQLNSGAQQHCGIKFNNPDKKKKREASSIICALKGTQCSEVFHYQIKRWNWLCCARLTSS